MYIYIYPYADRCYVSVAAVSEYIQYDDENNKKNALILQIVFYAPSYKLYIQYITIISSKRMFATKSINIHIGL